MIVINLFLRRIIQVVWINFWMYWYLGQSNFHLKSLDKIKHKILAKRNKSRSTPSFLFSFWFEIEITITRVHKNHFGITLITYQTHNSDCQKNRSRSTKTTWSDKMDGLGKCAKIFTCWINLQLILYLTLSCFIFRVNFHIF